jgi:hypothetical protein
MTELNITERKNIIIRTVSMIYKITSNLLLITRLDALILSYPMMSTNLSLILH